MMAYIDNIIIGAIIFSAVVWACCVLVMGYVILKCGIRT